ncbi:MAG: sigma-70 family RNA polymerase sigma factor [Clostridia bacterium]|nr:sigma-70 family RNA polymerase sigma factor [Clostridia bacterium]
MLKILKKLISLIWPQSAAYYVNGAATLPPPLTPEEEKRCTDTIDEPASRRTLVEHNLRLVVYIAKKFETTGIGIEDLVSIGTIGLIKAVNTYKSDKRIKLATYASRCIENEILMFIRKTSGSRCEVSLDEPLNVDWDGNELLLGDLLGGESDDVFRSIEEREDRRMIRGALANLPCRDRTIIELRFGFARGGKELTQKEVADLLGISQSYISRLEKKIMARLRDDLKKVGY